MNWFTSLLGAGIAAPIDAIGNVIEKIYTTDGERLSKQIVLDRIAQEGASGQISLNKVEAAHRSIFVAGWRPLIGWICGVGLLNQFIIFPYATIFFGAKLPTGVHDGLIDLVIAMLGVSLGTLRTFEKMRGHTR